ncbi:MAG TPA: hypothetical protein VFO62_10470 [Candidatus Binatia bacterium]|nr:hypothetical protein [Candidatus Binatia bacterium]
MTTPRSMDHSGCLRCGETREDQRHSTCQGRRLQSHDWYTLEFAVCRAVADQADGFGGTKVLTLRYPVRLRDGRPRSVWPADYAWGSSTSYSTRFATLDEASACITALRLEDVDIRRCEFPTQPDHLPVVWPPEAIQAGIERREDHERAIAAMHAEMSATTPSATMSGDGDRWLGDEIGRALRGELD